MPTTTAPAKFAGQVYAYLQAEDRTIGWLSRATGIPDSTLRRQLEQPETLSFLNLVRIVHATGVKVVTR